MQKNMKERIDIHYKKNNKNLILKDILNSLGFSKQDNYGTFSINLKKKIKNKKGFCKITYGN